MFAFLSDVYLCIFISLTVQLRTGRPPRAPVSVKRRSRITEKKIYIGTSVMFNFVYIYARAKRVLEPVTRNSQIQLHNDIIIIYVYTHFATAYQMQEACLFINILSSTRISRDRPSMEL